MKQKTQQNLTRQQSTKTPTKGGQVMRPPIVVVMGHIDHGKTALLDQIRKTRVMEKESGGITQHIGAYQVEEKGKKITFIDTPGHEAFSLMRSRGAKVADIAILVIDGCEGIKPQTKEVISHIKEAEIPVIVAINKVDKPGVNPEKVKGELSKEDMLVESMGGKIPCVEVSAQTGQGIPELLDMILLVAEMEGLEADPQKPGEGVIIESYLDNFRGPTATLLLTNGSLKSGDIVGTLTAYTKIKSLEDFLKKAIREALPSTPVIIFGFNDVPRVGEEFKVFLDIDSAEIYTKSLEVKASEVLEVAEDQRFLNLILKTDVAGSIEAIEGILKNLPQDKIILRIVKSEVGNINESDLKLAKGRRVFIMGFRVKIDPIAKKVAEREKIKTMTFEVIYDLVEGIRKLMEKNMETKDVRTDLGKMKVLVKFLADKNRQILGGKITEGEIRKGALIEVFRNEEKVGQGKIVNLQRNKKDADVVSKGEECGILFEGDTKAEERDILLIYTKERRKEEL